MNIPDNMTLQATVEQDGGKSGVDTQTWSNRFSWVARTVILLAVVLAPWALGSVQNSSQFWISTAMLIALAFWWFETALNKRNSQVLPYISIFVMIGILLGAFQTLPLSGSFANMILGRQVELYQEFTQAQLPANSAEPTSGGSAVEAASTSQPSARISLDTTGTWHQVRLLVIALAAILLCCRYFRTPLHLTIFLSAMTVNGVAISIFGAIQKLSTNGKELFWSIPLTMGGTPFGPYVNRNNAAGYLLICLACSLGLVYMILSVKKNRGPVPIISKEIPFWRQVSQQLLYFVSELTAPKLAALIGVVFIALGIFASLSRGAVLGLLVGALLTIISYGVAKRPKNMGLVLLPVFVTVVSLTVWLGFSDQLIGRFDQVDSTQEVEKWDGRLQTWTDTWPSVGEMGKLGSGLGTYKTVSRLYRTDKETRVYDYAENQYFQTLIEAGWFGLVVYMLAWGLAFYYSYFLLKIGQSPSTVGAGLAGVFLFWSQAVASFLDFGFYIPANTLAMACVTGVIAYYAHSMAYRLKQKSFLRFQFPNSTTQFVLIALFAVATATCFDLNRKSSIEALKTPRIMTYENFTIEQVDEQLKSVTKLARRSPSVPALNECAALYIHRARLELFELNNSKTVLIDTDLEQKQRNWDATSLANIQELSEENRRLSKLSRKRFLDQEFIQANLPIAIRYFETSLYLSPMQPEVQFVLGELYAILDDIDKGAPYLERAVKLAPSNLILLNQAALLFIQAGQFEQAAPHLSRYLDLMPRDFDFMMNLTSENMINFNQEIDHDLIVKEMLPENPRLIYRYASDYAVPDSLVQKSGLEKAEDLLEGVSQSEPWVMILRGEIKLAMGDYVSGIEFLKSALVNNPNDQDVRLKLIEAQFEIEQYDEAFRGARELIRSDEKNKAYRRVYNRIKSKIEELQDD